MFERYTDRARRVVVLAQDEARYLNHSYICSEHLLLALIAEAEGIAAQALEPTRITLSEARKSVADIVGEGQRVPSGHLPFTPEAKSVLDHAGREAAKLGDNFISTEHLLLSLLGLEQSARVYRVFDDLGLARGLVRANVMRLREGTAVQSEILADPDETREALFLGRLGGRLLAARLRITRQHCTAYPDAAEAAVGIIEGYFNDLQIPRLSREICVKHAVDFQDLINLAQQAGVFSGQPAMQDATQAFARACLREHLAS